MAELTDPSLDTPNAKRARVIAVVVGNNLGNLLVDANRAERASITFRRALDVCRPGMQRYQRFRTTLLGNLLNAYNSLADPRAARLYADSLTREDLPRSFASVYSYLGEFHRRFGSLDSAAMYFGLYLEGALAASDPVSVQNARTSLARVAIRKGDAAAARALLSQALPDSTPDTRLSERVNYYLATAEEYAAIAMGARGLADIDSLVAVFNRTAERSQNEVLLDVSERYEAEDREREIDRLAAEELAQKRLARRRLYLIIAAAAVIAALAALAYLLLRARREAERRGRQLAAANTELVATNQQLAAANTALDESNAELETAYGELNHRTANQLQMAYYLVLGQRRQIGDARAEAVLQRSEAQLLTLAELNRLLAKPTGSAVELVRADEILAHVARKLREASPQPFALDLQLEALEVDANAAMNAALVLSELISNSIKYAFPDTPDARAHLRVVREPGGAALVEYVDNGPGPQAQQAVSDGQGTGLIQAMLKSLRAEAEPLRAPGQFGLRWRWRPQKG